MRLIRDGFSGLKAHKKKYALPAKINHELSNQAAKHYIRWTLRVAFYKWGKYIKEEAVPKKIRNRIANIHYRTNLLSQGMKLLIENYTIYY
jgi:hypothetical protein